MYTSLWNPNFGSSSDRLARLVVKITLILLARFDPFVDFLLTELNRAKSNFTTRSVELILISNESNLLDSTHTFVFTRTRVFRKIQRLSRLENVPLRCAHDRELNKYKTRNSQLWCNVHRVVLRQNEVASEPVGYGERCWYEVVPRCTKRDVDLQTT